MDLTRQALQDFSIPIYKQLVNEYNNKSATGVRSVDALIYLSYHTIHVLNYILYSFYLSALTLLLL